MNDEADAVLEWWFETLPAGKRFARDDAVDAEIARRFGALHARLASGVPDSWRADARTMLAAIIILDQFSRNIFRDDPRAFANDAVARALTKEALDQRWHEAMSPEEVQFLTMPLMHSERLADIEHCARLMREAGSDDGAAFADRHAATIERFGRYPARNAALGRATTAEEAAFLREVPTGF